MKVYTKTGDRGTTGLVGGQRIKKDSQRIEAYGTVDELIAFIANLIDNIGIGDEYNTIKSFLLNIEDKLMIASSILATKDKHILDMLPKLSDADVTIIENEIDRMEEKLNPLNNFILPGGSIEISCCHIARTVCRRAEREIIRLSNDEDVDYLIVRYINRLSDYLFILSRYMHKISGIEEIVWKPKVS